MPEARAMNVKAEAFQEYNQAAVLDKLLTSLLDQLALAVGMVHAQSGSPSPSRRASSRAGRALATGWWIACR